MNNTKTKSCNTIIIPKKKPSRSRHFSELNKAMRQQILNFWPNLKNDESIHEKFSHASIIRSPMKLRKLKTQSNRIFHAVLPESCVPVFSVIDDQFKLLLLCVHNFNSLITL